MYLSHAFALLEYYSLHSCSHWNSEISKDTVSSLPIHFCWHDQRYERRLSTIYSHVMN